MSVAAPDRSAADNHKTRGNDLWAAKDVTGAIAAWTLAINETAGAPADPTRIAALANRARAWLEQDALVDAENDCTSVLAVQPQHIKALFRRAEARLRAGQLAKARDDMMTLKSLDTSFNGTTAAEYKTMSRRLADALEGERDPQAAQAAAERVCDACDRAARCDTDAIVALAEMARPGGPLATAKVAVCVLRSSSLRQLARVAVAQSAQPSLSDAAISTILTTCIRAEAACEFMSPHERLDIASGSVAPLLEDVAALLRRNDAESKADAADALARCMVRLADGEMQRMTAAVYAKAAIPRNRSEQANARSSPLVAELPTAMRRALEAWAGLCADALSVMKVRAALNTPAAISAPCASAATAAGSSVESRVDAVVAALASVADTPWEGFVNALDEGGALRALLRSCVIAPALVEAGPTMGEPRDDARSRAEVISSRARATLASSFKTLLAAAPKGYMGMGRAKLRALLLRVVSPLVDDLAAALPPTPATTGTAATDAVDVTDLPEPAWTDRQEERAAAAAALTAALRVDREAGVEAARETPGLLPAVIAAAGAASPALQLLALEALSELFSDETGRGVAMGAAAAVDSANPSATSARLDVAATLGRLVDAASPRVSNAAEVILAKIAAPSKSFGRGAAGKNNADSLIGVVLHRLDVAVLSGPAPRGGSDCRSPLTSVDLVAAAAAIESLAMVALHTRTKHAIMPPQSPSARAAPAPPSRSVVALLRAAAAVSNALLAERDAALGLSVTPWKATGGTASSGPRRADAAAQPLLRPTALGLAFILQQLTTSSARERDLALADRGVDVKQYRELMRFATPAELRGDGDDTGTAEDDDDPQDVVDARIESLVAAGAVRALAQLGVAVAWGAAAPGAPSAAAAAAAADPGGLSAAAARAAAYRNAGGAATREIVAHALANITSVVSVRGGVLASGGLAALVGLSRAAETTAAIAAVDDAAATAGARLGHGGVTQVGAMAAGQAIARLLITAQPSAMTESEAADAAACLLRVVRESASQLQIFEATLALTNIASRGPEARGYLIGSGALAALESVQHTEDLRLRRAGTEALANLSTETRGAVFITGAERVRLWLALAAGFGSAPEPAADSADASADAPDDRTACAAAGGLAMALAVLAARRDGDDDDDDDDGSETSRRLARSRGAADMRDSGRPTPPPRPTRQQLRDAAAADARLAVHCFVDADGVGTMVRLLLSGKLALVHRAASAIREVAAYARGVAALLTPIEGHSPLTPLALLVLVASGRDPALMSAQHTGAGSGRTSATPHVPATIPEPIRRVAQAAAARALRASGNATSWATVVRAATTPMAAANTEVDVSEQGNDSGAVVRSDAKAAPAARSLLRPLELSTKQAEAFRRAVPEEVWEEELASGLLD